MPVTSYGTDHDIFRLGDDLAVRLPRIAWATGQAVKEAAWLPRLAPHSRRWRFPAPVAMGQPGEDYPYDWSVCAWLPGESADGGIRDLGQAAVDLAAFVTALRGIDTTGAPPRRPGSRGGPWPRATRRCVNPLWSLVYRIDGAAVLRSWEESLAAPLWDGPDVWLHGDLLPGNLLLVDGRLSGVIDFGTLSVGDPAGDLLPAWNVFAGASRERFRAELEVDDAAWLRGRGWALRQAVMALPYYWSTNPGMVRQSSRALDQVLTSG